MWRLSGCLRLKGVVVPGASRWILLRLSDPRTFFISSLPSRPAAQEDSPQQVWALTRYSIVRYQIKGWPVPIPVASKTGYFLRIVKTVNSSRTNTAYAAISAPEITTKTDNASITMSFIFNVIKKCGHGTCKGKREQFTPCHTSVIRLPDRGRIVVACCY